MIFIIFSSTPSRKYLRATLPPTCRRAGTIEFYGSYNAADGRRPMDAASVRTHPRLSLSTLVATAAAVVEAYGGAIVSRPTTDNRSSSVPAVIPIIPRFIYESHRNGRKSFKKYNNI